jgi:predicted DNA-binding protein (MmcQ/YjbR family)
MNVEDIRLYCLSKPGVEESFPFDEHTLVFKVLNKMYALINLKRVPFSINLKCDPEKSIMLREEHEEIQPGYHMNKKHWNTVDCEGRLSDKFIVELIDHSYDLVWASLPKKVRIAFDEGS